MMKYYAVTYQTKDDKENQTDLVKTELDQIHVNFYYSQQDWLKIKAIVEVTPYFSELTIKREGERVAYLLDGEE